MKADRTGMISAPRPFWGGVGIAAVALTALCAASGLSATHGYTFGAGTMPRLVSWLLLGLSGLLVIIGVTTKGEPMPRFAYRGPFFLALSILAFALAVQPLGLVIASFVAYLIAGLASSETRWGEALIAAAVITAFCSTLFKWVLGLPFPLWPSLGGFA